MNMISSKLQVLLVDDEKSLRITLKDFLEDDGFEVVAAEDIQQAKKFLEACDFDVAVIDRILSNGESGMDLLMHIKQTNPYCQTIMMTAYPTVESARITLQTGTCVYLVKPFSREDICGAVKEAADASIEMRKRKLSYVLAQNNF